MSEEETIKPDVLAEEPRKPKAPITGLLLIIIGLGLIVLITGLWAFLPESRALLDGSLQAAALPAPALYEFIGISGNYICIGVAIAALIIVIMFAVKSTRPKVAPIAKYAGLIVLTFAFTVGLAGFLLGGFAGLFGTGLSVWFMLLGPGFSTWPAFPVLVASSLLAVPLCFNRKKTRVLSILTLVGVGLFIYLAATASIYYSFFDVAWAIFIGGFFAGFFYKSLLAIPEQERWDTDAHVLGPMREAYKKILMAKAIREQKPVKIVHKIETEEGIKEEVKEEVPQGKPEEVLKEAIRLYSETEERAAKHGKVYKREIAKCQVWKQRITRLLEEQQLVAAQKMPEAEYHKRWIYIF